MPTHNGMRITESQPQGAYRKPATSPISISFPWLFSEALLTVEEFFAYLTHKMLREENTGSGDLIQGTLEMLVLKALARGPLHGYAVAEWIHQTSQQLLKVEEGALYPALHRLELRGLLKAAWGASENNRRARFYRLTKAGRKQLEAETRDWEQTAVIIAGFLNVKAEDLI